MATEKRVYYEGAIYHVILRGNNKQNIFFEDRHRSRFCELVEKALKKFPSKIHAFCLMSNHVHFLFEVEKIPLSMIIQFIASNYSRWLNRELSRVGHLFQSRHKAILVEKDEYLLELVRYIHLNPVRAGLVKNPAEYFWSGHNDYLGSANFAWLNTERILDYFINSSDKSKAYASFLAAGMGYVEDAIY